MRRGQKTAPWSLAITPVSYTSEIRIQFRVSHFICDLVMHTKREYRKKGGFPSLEKEGWLRPSGKCCEASLAGRRRGGSFKPPIIGRLNEPPRPRLAKERGYLLNGAATPPFPRRGILPSHAHGQCPNSRRRSMNGFPPAGRAKHALYRKGTYARRAMSMSSM